MSVLALDPNPLDWIKSGAGSIVNSAVDTIIVKPVVTAAQTVVKAMLGFFNDSSTVHLRDPGTWWNGPSTQAILAKVLGLSALVMLAFVFIAVIQGVLAGDAGSLVRTVAKEVPVSVFAIAALVVIADLLLAVTDSASSAVMANTTSDWSKAVTDWGAVADLSVGGWLGISAIVLFIIGALFVWIELIIRSSLIYLLIAIAPLFFAARVWAPAKAPSRKLIEVGVALIVAKFVVALALALGAAALASGGGGALTAAQLTSGRAAYITQQCATTPAAAAAQDCQHTAGDRFDRSLGGEDSFLRQQCPTSDGSALQCAAEAKVRYQQLIGPAKTAQINMACAGKAGQEGLLCAKQASADFDKNADQSSFAAKLGGVLSGAALSLLAAFAPFMLLKLMPIAEAALVAQGIKGGPVRAGMQMAGTAATGVRLAGAAGGGVGAAKATGARSAGGGDPVSGAVPAATAAHSARFAIGPAPVGTGPGGGNGGPGGGSGRSGPAATGGAGVSLGRLRSPSRPGPTSAPPTGSAGSLSPSPPAGASETSSRGGGREDSGGATSLAARPVRPTPVGLGRPPASAGPRGAVAGRPVTADGASDDHRDRELGGS